MEEWRLVFVTPRLEREGDKRLIKELRQVLKSMGDIFPVSVFDIDIESPYDPVMIALGKMVHIGDAVVEFKGNSLNDIYFGDFILYRVRIESPYKPSNNFVERSKREVKMEQ